jgi:tetratricopeptide (TPR) repeat protein
MATTTPVAAQAIDAETAERLGALGYLGAGGASPVPTGKDPKDGIGLATRLGRNGMTVARTQPDKAIRELTALLAEDPGMLVALRTRAVAYETLGQHEAAIQDLRALDKQGALTAEDSVVLGDNLRMAGRLREATEMLQGTAGKNPKFAQPLLSLAAVFVQEKKNREAAATFEKVLAISADNLEALRGLGDLGLMEGDLAIAESHYGRILQVDPKDTGAMTKMGVVRMRQGRGDEAVALFQRAIEREPKNGEALLYLAGALAAGGRAADALPYFERALAAGQRSSMALNGLGLARLEVGDRSGAAAAFEESLRIDPQQPEIARSLAGLGSR